MKKIIISLAIIAAVAAVGIGVTVALFSDTETSAGNIFTAGSIDLKVDHLAQTYNGDDCETCSLTLWSGDGGADVVAGVNTVINVFPYPAVLVTPTPITTQYWTTHPTADWIWASDPTLVGDDGTLGDVTYTFEHEFNWWGAAVDVDLVMDVAGDNQYQVLLNGTPIATGVGGAQYTTLDSVSEALFLAEVEPGQNTLTFTVTNLVNTPAGNNNPLNNPGGLLYYLIVERDPEDCDANSDFQQACRLWTETDLTDETFFNFGDVKPEDEGTNLISLHVSSNDAFVCLIPNNVQDDENSVVEPEVEAGDNLLDGVPNRELSDQIEFFGWADDGNGTYEDGEEVLIPAGTSLNDIQTEMIEMSLSASDTGYIGLAWCAGTQTGPQVTDEDTALNCDGSGMTNIVQTDKATADLVAYAVQQRNNEEFSCADVDLSPE